MCTGAPAFGTPEYTKAAQATGQLARQIVVRFRGSNVATVNEIDAQAAYDSQIAIWGAMMGGAHLLNHCAGWMHGGLTASFEKLILDAEMRQIMDAYFSRLVVDKATLALDAIREAGPGGHFFGTAQTMDRFETAFHTPLLSNWDNFPNWLEKGGIDARARANLLWKTLLQQHEDPAIDQGLLESLDAYVAYRKEQGGAPMN
jgi:trimethylamine---corrinoid protein Co-methyltransferase